MTEKQKRNYRKDDNATDALLGKIPPQAIEVEEAVLGAVMLERDAVFKVQPIINTADAFYREEHRLIFKTVEELARTGKNIDLMTVTQKLKDNGKIDKVGGPGFITQLTRRVASAAHIEQHARIIAQKYFQREMIRVFSLLLQAGYDSDIDELELLYTKYTQEIDSMLAGNSGMVHIRSILLDSMRELDRRQAMAIKGEIPGINTGLVDLNKRGNGWQPGDLIILAARPSMGKTAIALNLFAKSAAIKGKNVCIFSLEMENIKLSNRMILSYGGIERTNFERGTMTDGDWTAFNNAVAQLEKLPIYIDDTPGPTVNYISAVVRNKARKNECDLVIIDYLQLVESPESSGYKNREREVAEISRALKKVAKENNVPVILLAQLNRGVENREDKTPRLADLRESGAIEQDADLVIFPWRPCYYNTNATDESGNSLENIMLLEIAKFRDGRIGTIFCRHNDDLTQFFDFNTYEQYDPDAWMNG